MLRCLVLLFMATSVSAQDIPRILVVGDSVMEWNADQSVADILAEELGEAVLDESVSGARFSHRFSMLVGPMDIRAQVPRLPFDWVIATGGANDLAVECDCSSCDAVLDELITADAALGQIPDFVERLSLEGTQVLWVTYYDMPRVGGPFTDCQNELDELHTRIELLALKRDALHVADMGRAIDPDDLSHYDPDRLHPSVLGSRRIAQEIATRLRDLER